MITKESLQEKYIKLETIDLLEIVARKDDHTELAVSVAKEELRTRNVPEEEIRSHKSVAGNEERKLEEANGLVDLEIWRKIVLYFLWVPKIRKYFTEDYVAGGYILKSNQARYYSIMGCIFFILGGISFGFFDSFVWTWFLGFLPVYLFDVSINKPRLTEKINKVLAQKERPFGYY